MLGGRPLAVSCSHCHTISIVRIINYVVSLQAHTELNLYSDRIRSSRYVREQVKIDSLVSYNLASNRQMKLIAGSPTRLPTAQDGPSNALSTRRCSYSTTTSGTTMDPEAKQKACAYIATYLHLGVLAWSHFH